MGSLCFLASPPNAPGDVTVTIALQLGSQLRLLKIVGSRKVAVVPFLLSVACRMGHILAGTSPTSSHSPALLSGRSQVWLNTMRTQLLLWPSPLDSDSTGQVHGLPITRSPSGVWGSLPLPWAPSSPPCLAAFSPTLPTTPTAPISPPCWESINLLCYSSQWC